MATSNSSTGHEWNDLPLFAEGTPASLSVQQVIAKVKKILATCGLGYDKPLASYAPTTQFWKMSEGIFPSGEQPLLPILPPSGMTRNGELFQQPPWEPLTGETASSSWPTPTTQDHIVRRSTQQKTGSRHSVGLGDAVRMWPTPTTQEVEHPNMELTETGRRKASGGGSSHSVGLADAVHLWPTPTHGKLAGGQGAFNRVQELYSQGTISDEERKAMQAGNGGKLNPMWVEWLMGFPPGWTDLED
jgi:DNA (cytosine-5)-methyltransferase 1